MKALVLGASHVMAISRALQESPDESFGVHNLNREMPELVNDAIARKAIADQVLPIDALCLCLGGNLHNILTLLNDPKPFCIAPSAPNGQLVPLDMMSEHMAEKSANLLKLAKDLMQVLPAGRTLILNPPPPSGDPEQITNHPSSFAPLIESGVSPDALRLQSYQIQTRIYQDHARQIGAIFVPNPAEAVDERGFLRKSYWANDPTHANTDYGHLVLTALRKALKDLT